MDIIIAEDLHIQCECCGRKYMIDKDSLDVQTYCYDGRGMGEEIEYHFIGEMDCQCGNALKYDVQAWEYPIGALNYTDKDTEGCSFIKEPVVSEDYTRDYYEFEYSRQQEECILDDIDLACINIDRVLVDRDYVYSLTPSEFEYMVAQVFMNQGYHVNVTQKTRDGGADIIATKNIGGLNYMLLIECKRYIPNNKVGVGLIRSLRGVQADRRVNKAVLVTSSTFTRDARKFAENQESLISLIDINGLIKMMRDPTS